MESKKDADALGFSKNVSAAMTTYERSMRDINNIGYMNDLTAAEQDAKKLEYYYNLINLGNTTPLSVKNIASNTYISYPTNEEILNISGLS